MWESRPYGGGIFVPKKQERKDEMPRRKNPRLRNGFGSIRYLGKGRRKPYAVFPPAKDFDERGRPKYDRALTYTASWNAGFSALLLYHAKKWEPGMEPDSLIPDDTNQSLMNQIVNEIISRVMPSAMQAEKGITFKQAYEGLCRYKFGGKMEYSASSISTYNAGFNNCAAIHDKQLAELKLIDLQKVVDDCPLRHASKELIVLVIKQTFKYAIIHEFIEKDPSTYLRVNVPEDDIHGVPFSNEELAILWTKKDSDMAAAILIMCYSGFRIGEMKTLEVNLSDGYFFGGSKTKAGKDRYVPIHSGILPLVRRLISGNKMPIFKSLESFRRRFKKFLSSNQLPKHTPHDTRHTFAKLCDEYYVFENDKKRVLGHAFSDVTNKVYGHRDIESLREQIEKIQLPSL